MTEKQYEAFMMALAACGCRRCDRWPCECPEDMGTSARNARTILDEIFALGVASMDARE